MNNSPAYISTRGDSPAVTLSAAIDAGLAPDGGLYVPHALPRMHPAMFTPGNTLADTAEAVLAPFVADDPIADALPGICSEALDFDAPLRSLKSLDAQVLELFHGPSAAFKDVGAGFLAACLRRLPRADNKPLTLLVATSGDTGAAVGAAFHHQPGTRVVILYPDGLISQRQAHHLGSFGDNVRALRVQGRFDDCQRMLKAALNDGALQAKHPLSTANSISLGRLLPQMSYYAHAALTWWQEHESPLNFIVPTGNLGNALAAFWAREMGLPIGKVLLSCNANRTLPEFFDGDDFRPRAAVATLANAMDVGAPSNFERLRWTFPDDQELRAKSRAWSVDDATIRETIAHHAKAHGEVFCPHTATAVHVLDTLREAGNTEDWAVVATAHPAKFESVVEPLIGHHVPVPRSLSEMLERPAHAEPIEAGTGNFQHWLRTSLGKPHSPPR